jgi:hypothetical protein
LSKVTLLTACRHDDAKMVRESTVKTQCAAAKPLAVPNRIHEMRPAF